MLKLMKLRYVCDSVKEMNDYIFILVTSAVVTQSEFNKTQGSHQMEVEDVVFFMF